MGFGMCLLDGQNCMIFIAVCGILSFKFLSLALANLCYSFFFLCPSHSVSAVYPLLPSLCLVSYYPYHSYMCLFCSLSAFVSFIFSLSSLILIVCHFSILPSFSAAVRSVQRSELYFVTLSLE